MKKITHTFIATFLCMLSFSAFANSACLYAPAYRHCNADMLFDNMIKAQMERKRLEEQQKYKTHYMPFNSSHPNHKPVATPMNSSHPIWGSPRKPETTIPINTPNIDAFRQRNR